MEELSLMLKEGIASVQPKRTQKMSSASREGLESSRKGMHCEINADWAEEERRILYLLWEEQNEDERRMRIEAYTFY